MNQLMVSTMGTNPVECEFDSHFIDQTPALVGSNPTTPAIAT